MADKHQVLAAFDADPSLSSGQIADMIDCDPAYVRATLKRNNRKLKRITGTRDKLANSEGYTALAQEFRERAARMIERAEHYEQRAKEASNA